MSWYGGAKKQVAGRTGKPNAYGVRHARQCLGAGLTICAGYSRQDARDPNSGKDNLGCGNVNNDDGSTAWFLRAAVRLGLPAQPAHALPGFRCAR
jgi:hypothetical protein